MDADVSGQARPGGLDLEAELAETVEHARQLHENGVDGLAVFDRDLQVRYWGPQMEALSGIGPREAMHRSAYDLHPTLRDLGTDRHLTEAADGSPRVTGESFFPRLKSMRPDALELFYLPLHGRSGRIVGVAVVTRNRLEFKELHQQVGEADARFKRMADSAPVLLWMAGTDGRCYFFNQTWLQFTGRALEQEQGYGWAEGVHAEDFERCMSIFMDGFAQRRPFEMEYRLLHRSGAYRWVLDRGLARYTPDGEFVGFIGSCVDIDDRKRAEEAALRSSRRLRRANAELEKFAYVAAHDLRAPLRAIEHLTAWVVEDLDELEPGEIRQRMALVRQRVARMDHLLTSLLSYARADPAGHDVEEVDLEALLEKVLDVVRDGAPGFAFDVQAPLPVLRTARAPLQHVLLNLLDNAVKHHDQQDGRVRVSAVDVGEAVELRVTDDGPGIEPGLHEKVFEIFQTVNPRDKVEGSGMGLALVKRVVETIGGDITLESPYADGRGTAVRFTWPTRWPGSE